MAEPALAADQRVAVAVGDRADGKAGSQDIIKGPSSP